MMERFKMFWNIIFFVTIFFLLINPVFADKGTPVSMDFKGADLRDVFRTLAQIAGINLITHQSVQGEVTITLNDIPFSEAIELLTMINDLDYQWVGNTLLIAAPSEIEENFVSTSYEILNIEYASVNMLKSTLEGLMEKSKVIIDERTGTLIIDGEEFEVQKIKEIISRLDIPIPQVFLDVRVEEVSTTGLKKLGATQGSAAKLKFTNNPDNFMIDVALELPQFVEYLEQQGFARTLANPGLIALDGETSRLLIGDKIPVETEEEIDGKIKTSIKYIEAGIKLEFTPQISSDGYIILEVKPQISSLGEYLTRGYPLIRSREVETVVRIKDGETFIIGGLTRDEDRISQEEVPFLSNIPILGALFKHDEDLTQGTEIIILITPEIIYHDEDGSLACTVKQDNIYQYQDSKILDQHFMEQDISHEDKFQELISGTRYKSPLEGSLWDRIFSGILKEPVPSIGGYYSENPGRTMK